MSYKGYQDKERRKEYLRQYTKKYRRRERSLVHHAKRMLGIPLDKRQQTKTLDEFQGRE